jgi:hypothetical protein
MLIIIIYSSPKSKQAVNQKQDEVSLQPITNIERYGIDCYEMKLLFLY